MTKQPAKYIVLIIYNIDYHLKSACLNMPKAMSYYRGPNGVTLDFSIVDRMEYFIDFRYAVVTHPPHPHIYTHIPKRRSIK